MIHYHGTPITPARAAAEALSGRHAMVSFAAPEQLDVVQRVCSTYVDDNGAFSAYTRGIVPDWPAYYAWIEGQLNHPAFDWAVIPDVIDGSEEDNDALIAEWPFSHRGVPVWHMHESFERLYRLCEEWSRVALGSSGEFWRIGTQAWWGRMDGAMRTICDESGRPRTKLHMLRCLDARVIPYLPVASSDAVTVGRNVGLDCKWNAPDDPTDKADRAYVHCSEIDRIRSASTWRTVAQQDAMEFIA